MTNFQKVKGLRVEQPVLYQAVYLSILADEELLDITRQTLVIREESMKLGKLRFDHGVIAVN